MYRILGAAVAAVALAPGIAVAPAAHAAHAAPARSAFTGFTISTTEVARVTVSGRLTAADTATGGRTLLVETADDRGRGWRPIKLLRGERMPVTRDDGSFNVTYKDARYRHGHYRVRFAGDASVAPALSATVRDRRVDTRVSGWKVTPRKIRKGSYVTFSGVLQEKPGTSWKPLRSRTVWIEGRARGTKTWYWYAKPRTDAKGRFKARFRVSRDTYFVYTFYGDKTHYVTFPEDDGYRIPLVDVR
ncbi:hypothetical protein ACSNOI_14195 [Actinomadura kijaniata]|uniref:hypothetical protein n=1 Tax=Actinomadura kijaniata TaxID=46161 RepID=UPI003F1D0815